jgi:ketosteroid isomerase-like protein
MAIAARFFHRLMAEMTKGNVHRVVRAVQRDAEVEMVFLGRFRGREGWVTAFEQWIESFAGFNVSVAEIINPAGDHVIVVVKTEGQGTGSGIPIEGTYPFLLTIHDGMAVHGKFFSDRADALEAAGLSE